MYETCEQCGESMPEDNGIWKSGVWTCDVCLQIEYGSEPEDWGDEDELIDWKDDDDEK